MVERKRDVTPYLTSDFLTELFEDLPEKVDCLEEFALTRKGTENALGIFDRWINDEVSLDADQIITMTASVQETLMEVQKRKLRLLTILGGIRQRSIDSTIWQRALALAKTLDERLCVELERFGGQKDPKFSVGDPNGVDVSLLDLPVYVQNEDDGSQSPK